MTLFRPAAALVGRLRYAQKFVVVGLVLVIPLAVVAAAYVDLQRAQIDFSAKERQGVAYLGPLVSLTGGVVAARHAALVTPYASAPDLTTRIARVDQTDAALGAALNSRQRWRGVRGLVAVAVSGRGDAAERYGSYNAAVTALLDLIVHVGDESNLTLDPDLDTYYLMDTLQFRLPVLLDTAGRAVAQASQVGAGQARRGALDGNGADALAALAVDSGVLTSTRAALARAARTVSTKTGDRGVREVTTAGFVRVGAAADELIGVLTAAARHRRAGSVPPDAADRLRAAAERLAQEAAAGLDRLLRARIDRFAARALLVEVVAGAGTALAAYLFVGFYLSVTRPVRRIVATLHAVGHGDLSHRVDIDTQDELSYVGRALNDTIAQTERARDRLAERATHDSLTGLPNRAQAVERLDRALQRCRRTDGLMAVLFIDLDRFKIINDSLGHEAGDEVLRAVATRLRGMARRTDTVCRLAGDEFVVVSEGLTDPRDAVRIGQRCVTELSRPVLVQGGREVTVGASVGVAYTRGGNATADQLLRDADIAMYRAKQRGRGRVETFDDTLRVALQRRIQVEDDLRHAIDAGQLRVHYQPIVAAQDATVIGFEALVRWHHPERGLLGPAEFMAVAEESGLVVPLGAAVLTEACRQAARWRLVGPGGPHVAVNVSACQLSRPEFLPTVAGALADSGLDPDALWLEITETGIMADEQAARTTLAAVRRLGVHLAIDDFGTGYSPLTYLRRFPVEALKIDRTFVAGIGRDREDEAIVTMILALARALGLRSVAEGVETADQQRWLAQRGCAALQGYRFGRPGPPAQQWASLPAA